MPDVQQPGSAGPRGTTGAAGRVRTGRIARAAPLVALTGRTAGEAVVSALRRRGRADVHERAAQRYAESLGRSRGVLMKAGQILSFVSLGSMVEGSGQSVYQAALARLQDDAPPMEPELAASVITTELGAAPHEVFARFSAQPLAAASIGQVHAATTHDGREVVVKIQYPGVDEAIRADLANTELLATFFQLIRGVLPDLGNTDARALAAEVGERIGEEIDYHAEAANQQAFAQAYRGHPFARVPEVLGEYSTGRVLTSERSDGVRWAQARQADQELKDLWGEAIYRFTFGSLRRLGRFNADPHPGNYLFHPDGTVTFLDFGCVKNWGADQVGWMARAVQAVIEGNAENLLKYYTEQGFVPGAAPDADGLLAWARESLTPVLAPQPFTYTPEFAARIVDLEFSPRGPHSAVVQRLALPGEYLALSRIDLGVTSVLAGLRATGPWRAIREEMDLGAAPAGRYGEAESRYLADRAATDRAATDRAATDRAATDRAATDPRATDRTATGRRAVGPTGGEENPDE